MIEAIYPTLLESTGASKILDIQLIQELWSGYGELHRVFLDNGPVTLKFINLSECSSHPRGWSSDIGHRRKRTSYEIETHWYQNYELEIQGAIFPRHIASGYIGEYQYLILEDLNNRNFTPKDSLDWREVQACLLWLAQFHRYFLGKEPKGLWPVGTYWHLDTRPEELEALTDHSLKEAAAHIDSKLSLAKHKTFVHGDAKLANFLFDQSTAAAVDFQYIGGGVGVKDVAYFLSSVYGEEELHKRANQCLDFYFKALNQPKVEEEWRELYPYAWCDFYRFLKGWSPGHWKLNSYSENMKEKVLQWL